MNRIFNVFYILALVFLVTTSCSSQPHKGKIVIAPKEKFTIPNLGELRNTLNDERDTITARILVNGDTISQINFAKGIVIADSVIITAYGLNESVYAKAVIKLSGQNYQLDFNFTQSGVDVEKRFKVKKTKVVLNEYPLSKGSNAKGYLEYEAICTHGCVSSDYVMVVKGNFQVELK